MLTSHNNDPRWILATIVESGNHRFWGWREFFFVMLFWLLFFLCKWNQHVFLLSRGNILPCSPYQKEFLGKGDPKSREPKKGMYNLGSLTECRRGGRRRRLHPGLLWESPWMPPAGNLRAMMGRGGRIRWFLLGGRGHLC